MATLPNDCPKPPLQLCLGCGKPSPWGGFCRECLDRGLGPCEACEGRALLDVEEDAT
jgi:hypothetical protein